MRGRKLAKTAEDMASEPKLHVLHVYETSHEQLITCKEMFLSATTTGRMSANRPWIGLYQMKTANVDVEKTAYAKVL